MVMGEKLSMLKCELDCITHKKPLLWYFEAQGPKEISVMIQMHDGKTMLKKN